MYYGRHFWRGNLEDFNKNKIDSVKAEIHSRTTAFESVCALGGGGPGKLFCYGALVDQEPRILALDFLGNYASVRANAWESGKQNARRSFQRHCVNVWCCPGRREKKKRKGGGGLGWILIPGAL